LWDNRVSKTFKINERNTIEGIFDLFNTLNTNVILAQVTTNGPIFGQPYAGSTTSAVPMAIIPPRIFRLGVRWKF
jgi:hypothetical protein